MSRHALGFLVGVILGVGVQAQATLAATEAEQEFQAIRQGIPANWWEGGWEKRAELEAFLENHPEAPLLCAKAQYYLAGYYYSIRDYAKAIQAYQQLIEAYPDSPDAGQAEFELGQLYLNALNQPDKAVECYQKVITTYPSAALDPIAYVMMGRSHFRLGNVQEAVKAWQYVLATYPWADRQRVEAAVDLGDATLTSGDAAQALRYYKQAFLMAPASDPNLTNWVIDKIYTGFKHLDVSIVRSNQFIKYQKYGPNGEDGISQTADDLANPLAEF